MAPIAMTDRVGETRARLLDLIQEIGTGERIPAERELASRWGVARMTLRKAVDGLVLDGLLERRQRQGTFTSRPRTPRHLTISSFTEEMTRRGVRASSETLSLRHVRASTTLARQLRMPEGEPVIRFVRLRLGDGVPLAVETNYVPEQLVPGMTEDDLDGSWYARLADHYGIHIIAGVANVEAAMPDERTAALLGITIAQPCFRVRTVVRDRSGRVVEYGESIYRGDDFMLTVELLPETGRDPRGRARPPTD